MKELKDIDGLIKTDKNLQALAKQHKFNPKDFVDKLKGLIPKGEIEKFKEQVKENLKETLTVFSIVRRSSCGVN